jgi:hypothetical protein
MLFHFLIPILHPKKPSYILVRWANTVIASWSGEKQINWGFIMHKVIQDKVKSLKPRKLSYLPSYLAQLYLYGECQLETEINDKNVIRDIYGIADSDEEESNSEKTLGEH